MSNTSFKGTTSFELWAERHKFHLIQGFMSVYNNEPFDYKMSDLGNRGYEIGRQVAVVAKAHGIQRGHFVRKAPNKEYYVWVKKNLKQLEVIFFGLNPNRVGSFLAI